MRGSIDATRSRCHNRSVSLLPNDLITPAVYNVWRHTGQARLPGRLARRGGASNSFKRSGGRRRSRRRRPGGGRRRRSSGSMPRPVSSAAHRGALPPSMPPQLHPTHLTSTETSETTRLRVVSEVLVEVCGARCAVRGRAVALSEAERSDHQGPSGRPPATRPTLQNRDLPLPYRETSDICRLRLLLKARPPRLPRTEHL